MDSVSPELAYQQADEEIEQAVKDLRDWKCADGHPSRRQPWEHTPDSALRPVARELIRQRSLFNQDRWQVRP